MSGPTRSGLRTLIGNTLGGGLVVIGAAGVIDVPQPSVVIAGVAASPVIVTTALRQEAENPPNPWLQFGVLQQEEPFGTILVARLPVEPDPLLQPWLQPGVTPKPPKPPKPPKKKHRRVQETSGGAGGPDTALCPPEIRCDPAIAEKRLREILERADVEAPIEVWRPQEELPPPEVQAEEISISPSVIIVEVPVEVEVQKEIIVEVPVYVPVFIQAPTQPLPPIPQIRYITIRAIWPHLLIATAVAGVVVLMTNALESEPQMKRRSRRLT